ncbi:MAG: hypothetical protein PF448_13065 [Bacteroidales bacterium]|jgi:hypothetical protein|nr:hypothetical protein [Bacteroidales bacterium]
MENVKINTGKFLGKQLRYFIENDDLFLNAKNIIAILSLKEDALEKIEAIDKLKVNDEWFINEFAFSVLKQESKYGSTKVTAFVEKLPAKSMQYFAENNQNNLLMAVVNDVQNLINKRDKSIQLMDDLDESIQNLDDAILARVEDFNQINI